MNRREWSMAAALLAVVCTPLVARPAAALDTERVKRAARKTASWKEGDNSDSARYLSDVVLQVNGNSSDMRAVEQIIADALELPGRTPGRSFLCRQLAWIGTGPSIKTLEKLLTDRELSHMARFALEEIPGRESVRALRNALSKADEKLKIGIIWSLGRRGDTQSVRDIARYASSGDEALARAALQALGRIDSDTAVRAIRRARRNARGKTKAAADDAYLDVARRLAGHGDETRAVRIYEALYESRERSLTRVAALQGLVACKGERGVAIAIKALKDTDPLVREAAIPALRVGGGERATKAIASELKKHPVKLQVMLIKVLADRGDAAAVPDVTDLTESADKDVRLAAIEALGRLGDRTTVKTLARLAATAKGIERRAARASLDGLRADGVNRAIAGLMRSGDSAVRAECARSLGVRAAREHVSDVLDAAGDTDTAVAHAAAKSLKLLAGPEDTRKIVDLLVETDNDKTRDYVTTALVTAAKKATDESARTRDALDALRRRPSAKARTAIITALGKIGGSGALRAINDALRDRNEDVKTAAVRALAQWPTAEPRDTLKRLARNKREPMKLRIIALRGHISQIGLSEEATDEELVSMYESAMRICERTEEKKKVLFELSQMRFDGALAMARRYTRDAELRDAANDVVRKIEEALKKPILATASHNSDRAMQALDGKPNTRWDTGRPMAGGEWFMIDYGSRKTFLKVVLDTSGSGGDFPRGYKVYACPNSRGGGTLVAEGKGKGAITEITFDKPAVGRCLKIVQTGATPNLFWSIHELKVEVK